MTACPRILKIRTNTDIPFYFIMIYITVMTLSEPIIIGYIIGTSNNILNKQFEENGNLYCSKNYLSYDELFI